MIWTCLGRSEHPSRLLVMVRYGVSEPSVSRWTLTGAPPEGWIPHAGSLLLLAIFLSQELLRTSQQGLIAHSLR